MSVANRVVRWSTALDVLGVVLVAAVVSYEHASDLLRAHGETGWTARLIPLTVDGVIYGSWMTTLDSAPQDIELVRLSLCEALAEARQALACPGGDGLEQFLRGLGTLFAAHVKYAHLLLERSADGPIARGIRAAVQEFTSRALAAGTAGLRTPGPVSATPSMSAGQLAELLPRP